MRNGAQHECLQCTSTPRVTRIRRILGRQTGQLTAEKSSSVPLESPQRRSRGYDPDVRNVSRRRSAIGWHLATAAAVIVGLVWQLVLVVRGVNVLVDSNGALPTVSTRIIRYVSFFTVESNILVALTAATLARDPDADGRAWRILRLQALFGITVTGIVYSTLLRGVVELHGAAAVTNALLHYVSPVLTVLGWLAFGPRRRIDEKTLMLSLIWPALYVCYTFAHGAAVHWYPYPFIDVTALGYVTVLRNGVGLVVLLVGVGALYRALDRYLPGGATEAADALSAKSRTI